MLNHDILKTLLTCKNYFHIFNNRFLLSNDPPIRLSTKDIKGMTIYCLLFGHTFDLNFFLHKHINSLFLLRSESKYSDYIYCSSRILNFIIFEVFHRSYLNNVFTCLCLWPLYNTNYASKINLSYLPLLQTELNLTIEFFYCNFFTDKI